MVERDVCFFDERVTTWLVCACMAAVNDRDAVELFDPRLRLVDADHALALARESFNERPGPSAWKMLGFRWEAYRGASVGRDRAWRDWEVARCASFVAARGSAVCVAMALAFGGMAVGEIGESDGGPGGLVKRVRARMIRPDSLLGELAPLGDGAGGGGRVA